MFIETHKKNREINMEDNINMQIINAYYTEIFRRQDREKRLPDIKKFLIRLNETKKIEKQSPEQLLEVVKVLNGLFGGQVIEN